MNFKKWIPTQDAVLNVLFKGSLLTPSEDVMGHSVAISCRTAWSCRPRQLVIIRLYTVIDEALSIQCNLEQCCTLLGNCVMQVHYRVLDINERPPHWYRWQSEVDGCTEQRKNIFYLAHSHIYFKFFNTLNIESWSNIIGLLIYIQAN